jgi:RNA polymerase sigma factor (TIGR02999 family)
MSVPTPVPAPAAEPLPLTLLLNQAHGGDAHAAQQAYALLYPELMKIARARLRVHQAPALLDTAGLVHESFLRFVHGMPKQLESRKHFYAYAAKAMRHIVIDFVRRAQAAQRGGDLQQVTFDTAVFQAHALAHGAQSVTPVAELERALAALEALEPALAEVVELRFYGGYTEAEVAQALRVSERTVRRHWDKARAFLLVEMQTP